LTNKYRIAFVIPSLQRGGAEGQLLQILRHVDRSRFEPTLVLFENRDDGLLTASKLCPTFVLGTAAARNSAWLTRGPGLLLAIGKLRHFFSRSRPQLVYCCLPAAAIVGCIAAKMAGVPVTVIGRRSMLSLYRTSRLLRSADRFALKYANAVIGNCAAVTNEAIAIDGVLPERAFTVYNGVDTRRFTPGRETQLHRALGWEDDQIVVGMVANYWPYKRHVDFIRAAALIHERLPQSRFVLVGRDEGTFNDVRCEIANHHLENVVTILPATDKPDQIYRAFDVCVSTSESEGLSNVLLEAMACGKPVVATNVGGNPEVVQHGITGLIAAPHAPGAIADHVMRLIADPALRARMGRHARRWVEQEFSIENTVRSYESVFLLLLEKTARQHGLTSEPKSQSQPVPPALS
jgi:glycosyltransferase involved in cell wall biosynthesis